MSKNVKSGVVMKTEICQYLEITINEEGNLEEHIKVITRKCETIPKEIDDIGAMNQEEIRVKLNK